MNFWEHQENARRGTARLIVLYTVLVLALALAAGYVIDFLCLVFLNDYGYSRSSPGLALFLEPRLYLVALGFLAVTGVLCLLSPASLSAGGKSVAEGLKGTLVTPQTTDKGERRLLNVVEEMAIASGMPVPPVYILNNEPGINAFAAGGTINDAVIGVTRGTVEGLTREELQAVVAHEFSHILNGDMKLDLRFVQLLFGLMCLSDFCGTVMRGLTRGTSRSSRSKGKGGSAILFLVLLLVVVYLTGVIMSFVGSIIQAAVNRQREFLADASAVQFTRSDALASALMKIGADATGSKLVNTAMTSSYRHLFFSSISGGLFNTHPPLEERIRRIYPQWDGSYTATREPRKAVPAPENTVPAASRPSETSREAASAWEKLASRRAVSSSAWLSQLQDGCARPGAFMEVTDGSPLTLREAEALLNEAVRDPLDATQMVFGLLLDASPSVRAKQLAQIRQQESKDNIRGYAEAFAAIPEDDRIPVIERAIPALKALSAPQYQDFRMLLTAFIKADGVFSFKEWILYQLVISQAGAQFTPARVTKREADAAEAAGAVLSALARLSPEAVTHDAFFIGARELKLSVRFTETAPVPEKLSESIAVLAGCGSYLKESFMRAAARTVLHDGTVCPRETMFLRVLSLCLGIPVPPATTPAATGSGAWDRYRSK